LSRAPDVIHSRIIQNAEQYIKVCGRIMKLDNRAPFDALLVCGLRESSHISKEGGMQG
jgi:hypothetical protein